MSEEIDARKLSDLPKLAAEGGTTDEKVGYKHPPRHAQFKPGQSGNPRGRPKGRRSFKLDMAAALDAPIGEGRTNQQALAQNLVTDAVAGNALATKIVASIALSLDGEGESEDDATTLLQQKLVQDFDRRQEASEATEAGDHEQLP